MTNLKELSLKLEDISNLINNLGTPMTNGVNTLSSRIESFNNVIATQDYSYTFFAPLFNPQNAYYDKESIDTLKKEFSTFEEELPETKDKLSFDFIKVLKEIVQQDSFNQQWNELEQKYKSALIYADKAVYPILRQKLQPNDFNFMFEEFETPDSVQYPPAIEAWINTPSDSKVAFFKLRKAVQGTELEGFFNHDNIKNAESLSSGLRQHIAFDYFHGNSINKPSGSISWYERLDMLHDHGWAFGYTYYFLMELEDSLNGYDQVKKNIQLPDLLKQWSGKPLNEEQYQKEVALFREEIKDKSREEYHIIEQKYPAILETRDLQRGLKKEEFLNLKEASKNTPYETFFHSDMTEQMFSSIPYKRSDYMFVYFREEFLKNNTKKMKP